MPSRTSSRCCSSTFGFVAAAGFFAATAFAHVDDPKERDAQPAYAGPGWRASQQGGVAGGGPDFNFEGVLLWSWITVPEFGGQSFASDCWGYVSATNREYAIIGLSNGTGFVEVTDPGNPQILEVITGPQSTWRDMKVYQDHCYIVTEGQGQGAGIQVVDMSDIDNGNVDVVNTVVTGTGTISTHNVAINEDSGFLYRCGGGSNGLRIYDLTNPASPQYVATWSDRYCHDAQIVSYTDGPYAGKEIAFVCGGFNGGWSQSGLDVLDVTDKGNIILMDRLVYPNSRYSHQGWLSADKQYYFINDESDETDLGIPSTTHVIDVSNLNNVSEVSTFTNGSAAITHNLYVRDNFMFAANYRSGLRVFDISTPASGVEVAYYDTYNGSDAASFNGLWSVYPYFPSGIVLGSDREKGLFVWQVGGAYLTFGFPDGFPTMIDPSGDVLNVALNVDDGEIMPGTAVLHYDTGEGFAEAPMVASEGGTWQAQFPSIDCETVVSYYVSAQTDNGITWRSPQGAPGDLYETIVGDTTNQTFVQDFEQVDGWIVASTPALTSGAWTQSTPSGGLGVPAADSDGSGQCYVTDNTPGVDVDSGLTHVTSDAIDTTGDGEPHLVYDYWYYNDAASVAEADALEIQVYSLDTSSWYDVEAITTSEAGWNTSTLRLSGITGGDPADQIFVRFAVADLGSQSLVEAAIDNLRIEQFTCEAMFDPADVNQDGVINVQDLVEVIVNWGPCSPDCPSDIDDSGVVDVLDLLAVILGWTQP